MNRRPHLLAAIALAGLAACTKPPPEKVYDYDPYEGEAYPDRRAKLVVPPGGMGVVSDSRSDTVSFVDLSTGKRFAEYPVGRDPVTIDGPHHVAVDPARGVLYVALSYPAISGATGPHAAHGSSTVSGYVQKLSLADMSVLGDVRVDANPGDIVMSEDGKRVVVSHFDLKRAIANPGDIDAARSTLVVVNPDQILPAASPDPVKIPLCIAAHGVTLSRPDGKRAYAACYGEDVLAVVDLDDPKAGVKRVPVGPSATPYNPSYGPYAAVMSPDGKTIAVSNTVSKDVRLFDVASEAFTGAVVKTLGAPYFVAWTPDSKQIYIPTQAPDATKLVDLTQDPPVEVAYADTGSQCQKPHVVDFTGGMTLFAVCEGDQVTAGNVVTLDPVTLSVMGSTDVGAYPDAFVRVAGGGK